MAAVKMQFPVVLKAERPKLTHKSDAGAVRLGLTDGAAVAEAFEDFSRRLGAGPALLQRQAGPGAELILGARRDPLFGPMVMAGLGGVWTEILDDVALRLAPIEPDEARTMLDELRGRKLLAGSTSFDWPDLSPTCRNGFAPLPGLVNWTSIPSSRMAMASPSSTRACVSSILRRSFEKEKEQDHGDAY
jgi:hypothetical protein